KSLPIFRSLTIGAQDDVLELGNNALAIFISDDLLQRFSQASLVTHFQFHELSFGEMEEEIFIYRLSVEIFVRDRFLKHWAPRQPLRRRPTSLRYHPDPSLPYRQPSG